MGTIRDVGGPDPDLFKLCRGLQSALVFDPSFECLRFEFLPVLYLYRGLIFLDRAVGILSFGQNPSKGSSCGLFRLSAFFVFFGQHDGVFAISSSSDLCSQHLVLFLFIFFFAKPAKIELPRADVDRRHHPDVLSAVLFFNGTDRQYIAHSYFLLSDSKGKIFSHE